MDVVSPKAYQFQLQEHRREPVATEIALPDSALANNSPINRKMV
jgi:hypothetical protein